MRQPRFTRIATANAINHQAVCNCLTPTHTIDARKKQMQ